MWSFLKKGLIAERKGLSAFGVIAALLLIGLLVLVSTKPSLAEEVPLLTTVKSPQFIFFFSILMLFVFGVAFVNTDVALIILIFSMLLSPELKLADVPQRAVVVRIDDILLFVVFFSWLAKMAINKQLGLLKNTPLNLPIAAYILVCMLSTAIGILSGHVNPLKSSFYILKYVEYFMLFFMVSNNIRSKEQIRIFIIIFLITCALTCAYAIVTVSPAGRATAPFEGIKGEPNTLGGYLVLLFAVAAGIFLYSPSILWRFCCGVLTCFIFITLLQTLSRGSYLAFFPMYLTLIMLTRRKKTLLIGILLLGIFILPAMVPIKVTQRITTTFIPGKTYEPLGRQVTLDSSAAARIETWKGVLDKWKVSPFLGYGVSGIGLVDSQYPLILGEVGIIGMWIFIWLIVTIIKNSIQALRIVRDDWERGLTLGFLAGFMGLLIHCFAANTFIIVRIMEPFWFLAAIIVMLPKISEDEQESIP